MLHKYPSYEIDWASILSWLVLKLFLVCLVFVALALKFFADAGLQSRNYDHVIRFRF
jgi:hypothetical protein